MHDYLELYINLSTVYLNQLIHFYDILGACGEGQPGAVPICGNYRQVSEEGRTGGEPRQDGSQTGSILFVTRRGRHWCLCLDIIVL